jgi:predicted transcriptional regulator of viral defense system
MVSTLSRVKIALDDIQALFSDQYKNRVLLKKDIGKILEENRHDWRLTTSIYPDKFIDYLLNLTPLVKIELHAPNYDRSLTRYAWGDNPSIYQLALSIKPNSYFSHYTAMYQHNLTEQIPKTIYLNTEQSPKPKGKISLTQERIDFAFKRKQRTTNLIYHYNQWKISCLSGKHTKNLGVEQVAISEEASIPVTNIERTLIDIAVRPVYSGGVFEVLKAYEAATGKLSVNKLIAMLKRIDYIYPYHQAIGFYMQRAAYKESLLDIVKGLQMKYDFYLDYNMKETAYEKEWKLFIPKNF